MKNIIWLASYPKSGNTWFRIFLSNLMGEPNEPFDINNINGVNGIASARGIFDELCALESSCLTADATDLLRPDVYKTLSDEAENTLYIKVHDAYTFLPNNTPLFPASATKGVIYFIRNPLDITVSYANHNNCSIQKSIDIMADDKHCLSNKTGRFPNQLRQKLLSWGNHAKSWANAPDINVHLMRFEDMKLKPLETFAGAVNFLNLDYKLSKIEEALKKSNFDELQKQENEKGFREKSPKSKAFFRKGEIGNWREHLTSMQVKEVVKIHKTDMQKYGYLSPNGEIIF